MMRKLLFLFVSIILVNTAVWAQSIPDVPNPPRLVNDFAQLLQPVDAQRLEEKLLQFEQSSSNEIAVVTVQTIGDYEIQEFARDLGRKWNIGKAGKRNGVLLLIAVQERKVNISPGDGLQGVITDAICSRIIRNTLAPAFKQKAFYSGIDSACSQLMRASAGEFTAEPKSVKNKPPIVLIIIVLFFIIVFIVIMASGKHNATYVNGRGWQHRRRGPWDGGPGMPWGGGGFGGFGGGGGSSSGGGFGGFGGGGGGFDGGGASGSW